MRIFKLLTALSALFFTYQIFPQIPNGDFEQWSNGEPVGWWTNNFGVITISQSTDAHGGSFAVIGEVVSTTSGILQPLLISGVIGGHGFPVSERYNSLTGYYKLNAVTSENISMVLALFKNGVSYGNGGTQVFAASVYTKFTAPIFYPVNNTGIPDSIQITFTIGNNSGQTAVGSYFIIDDLALDVNPTDVDDKYNIQPDIFSLEQNYPNPFNPSTKIRYIIPSSKKSETAKVVLKIYDVLGKEAGVLVNEAQSAGTYEVDFNAAGLPSGIYFYKLKAGDFTESKKMILMK